MRQIITVIRELFSDGYKVVSIAAPILSILFVALKAVEWPVTERLASVSYAWAFAPITVWFLVSYVRRWRKFRSFEEERNELRVLKNYEDKLDELSQKFDFGNNEILNANISNRMEQAAWKGKWGDWRNDVEGYLEENFGLRERNMFKNLVVVHIPDLGGLNDDHRFERRQVAQQLETIREIIIRYSDLVQKS